MTLVRRFRIVRIALLALATGALATSPALAADDDAGSAPAVLAPRMLSFAPSSGSGPVVVVSGDSGTGNYEYFASDVARLGDSTVLVDGKGAFGRGIEGGAVLRRIIAEALAAPTARPGKVVVIGFSLGGGASLVHVDPDADHGFSIHGRGDRAAEMTDAWKRTRDRLARLSPLS